MRTTTTICRYCRGSKRFARVIATSIGQLPVSLPCPSCHRLEFAAHRRRTLTEEEARLSCPHCDSTEFHFRLPDRSFSELYCARCLADARALIHGEGGRSLRR